MRAASHPEESARLRLTDCEGRARTQALRRLSRLARPHGVPPEGDPGATPRPGLTYVAPGIPRVDPGLLTRLATLARRWPDRRILIVSGVRPRARRSSRHRVARALDVIVEGVERRRVSEFARGLAATGVGYYPNSTFTHVDVRAQAAYWIDLSGPGERARYVRPAPVTDPHVSAPPAAHVASDPRPEPHLAATSPPVADIPPDPPAACATTAAPTGDASPNAPTEPPLSRAEVAALGRQALRALELALAQNPLRTATRCVSARDCEATPLGSRDLHVE